MAAERCFDNLAADQLLDEIPVRRKPRGWQGARPSRLPGPFAVDLRDPASKQSQFFPKIHLFAVCLPIYRVSEYGTIVYIRKVIKSAVVPVAGHGTRLLPATKSQPKEMLPVARKPIVQYVVEELVRNGIEQILFVTGRNKSSIENHFDHDPELFRTLTETNKQDLLQEMDFAATMQAKFFYTRQRMQKGLGDAILCGENFAGEEPFLVALGDSILGLHANSDAVTRMMQVFQERRASCVIAVEEVPLDETQHYGIVQPETGGGDAFRVLNLVEKPRPDEAPSNLAIAGRYIFSPVIFDMIRRVHPDKRGEIQLTDAIQFLCDEGRRVAAVKLGPTEKRYDIGNFPSYFESFVEFALADPVYGDDFRRVLDRLLAKAAIVA
jgi:UTP--glucose-1-phosphate uridylyltransferase